MIEIPTAYIDLFERPVFVSVGVTLLNGQVQVAPLWCNLDSGYILINTGTNTARYRAWQTRPEATVMAFDPDNPYRYVEVRGRTTRFETAGADAHIDLLTLKYLGVERFPWHDPRVTRAICYVEPERVVTSG